VVREMRQITADWIEERTGTGAHRRWRFWPEELAEDAVSDEKFLRLGGISGGEGEK
jgi:hypothetical protein